MNRNDYQAGTYYNLKFIFYGLLEYHVGGGVIYLNVCCHNKTGWETLIFNNKTAVFRRLFY